MRESARHRIQHTRRRAARGYRETIRDRSAVIKDPQAETDDGIRKIELNLVIKFTGIPERRMD
jgi:hypothetical protein